MSVAAVTYLTPEMRNAAQSAQWKELVRQALCDARVAVPGIITAFDAARQVVTVQIALKEVIQDPVNGPTPKAIYQLADVPVVLPRGGGFSVTVPIVNGDECLLVFADMCIDQWWQSGGVQPQFELRRHDLSDAFCIPGPWSQPRVLSDYSTNSLQVRSDDGTVVIDVAASGVTVTAPNVNVVTPHANVQQSGGTPLSLVNHNFYQWFVSTYMPAVQYVTSAPATPSNPETTVLKGQ